MMKIQIFYYKFKTTREREESDAILPDRSVQRHSVTSLETARSLANGHSLSGGGGGRGRSMYSAFPGNSSVSYILLSIGGDCGPTLRYVFLAASVAPRQTLTTRSMHSYETVFLGASITSDAARQTRASNRRPIILEY